MNKDELKLYEIDSETKKFIKEQMEFYKDNRDKIKLTILAIIKDLIQLITNNNKIILLTHLTDYINNQNPTDHYDITQRKLPCYLEYALSLISAIDTPTKDNIPLPEKHQEFITKIINLFNLLELYYNTEDRKKEDTEKEIRVASILGYILNRGNAYSKHHHELLSELFEPHEEFLKKNFNFTIQNFQDYVNIIGKQINENRKSFIKFFLSLRGVKEEENNDIKIKKMHELYKKVYEIKHSDLLPEEFLQLFSTPIGANKEFADWTDAYWPLNNSLIYEKPIIKDNNKYYGFGIAILNTNAKEILENLIQSTSTHYFDRSYDKTRGKILESLSSKYFQKIFQNFKVYGRLFYPLDDNPNNKTDTDGLIIFDRNLLIIEAKANKYNIPAKRGSIKGIKDYMKNTIDLAYQQAIRTKKYIQKNKIAHFEDERGNKIIIRRDDFKRYFLINTTLEKLNHLSSNLHEIKELGFIQGKDWPWTVYINDLRIISEIVESPSIFLAYLIQRLEENNRRKLMTSDELDFFMYYLQERLGIFNKNLEGEILVAIDQMTKKLDEYYYYQKPKPKFKIPENIKRLIFILEIAQKPDFSTVCLSILELSPENIELLEKNLKQHRKMSSKHKKDKMSFYINSDNEFLIILIVRRHIESLDLTSSKKVLKERMLDYENLQFGIILLDTIKDGKHFCDFEILIN